MSSEQMTAHDCTSPLRAKQTELNGYYEPPPNLHSAVAYAKDT